MRKFFLGGMGDVNAPDVKIFGAVDEHAQSDSPECTEMYLFSIFVMMPSSVLDENIASSISHMTWFIASGGTEDGCVE